MSAYQFDNSFQTRIAAFVLRDLPFNDRTDGLIKPDYFEDASEGYIVDMAQDYYRSYRQTPDPVVLVDIVKDRIAKKRIRDDMIPALKSKIAELYKLPLPARDYVVDKVASFARHQAVTAATMKSVDIIDQQGDLDQIRDIFAEALDVGASDLNMEYDLFDTVTDRRTTRINKLNNSAAYHGISTGHPQLDRELYHRGLGRKELTLIMAPAKGGKSMGLANFAVAASKAGHHTLYVTLELSREITADRIESHISKVAMTELLTKANEVQDAMERFKSTAGTFKIHEYPSGSFKCSDLRRLIRKYQTKGIYFDLVVVDYADIMKPERYHKDPIQESKEIYVGLRAIAQEENLALLSATQTNREGAKKFQAKETDVADDFNKVRIADLILSLSASDDEKKLGEARISLLASRNQEACTLRVKQDRSTMTMIKEVLGRC